MSDRYAGYTHLLFEHPAERILKITINRPEKYNALNAVGHRELTYVWRESIRNINRLLRVVQPF
jgi:enoyl-CoA hydratase